jgi:hypothetical protein
VARYTSPNPPRPMSLSNRYVRPVSELYAVGVFECW